MRGSLMEKNKNTREICELYNITRQSLNSWFNQGLLKRPSKDFRNWYVWTEKDENNLKAIIESKVNENNKEVTNDDLLQINNRRYLGSKSKLLNFINEVIEDKLNEIEIVADIFSGTGVVADMFVELNKKVIVNDILTSNYISYYTWFGSEKVDYLKIKNKIDYLNSLEVTEDNYVSENFGDKYFSMENARKIGAIREQIDHLDLNNRERAFLLTSLVYAMDKVANTVGHYDAYRKRMDSFNPIKLRLPTLRENSSNLIYCEDANNLVRNIKADLVYIDTPYNSRQYGDAYHLLENIIEWEKPKVDGVAKKMVDRSSTKSEYCMKNAPSVFEDLIQNIDAKYILVSYNNMAKKGNGRSNAKISNEEIIESLKKRGRVEVYETSFNPFTTGKTGIEDHKELLYLCTVSNKKKVSNDTYKKSALNYTGGKYRLLKQIIPLFPEEINTFYDVFAGGCNVGINIKATNIYFNDNNERVIELYKTLQNMESDNILYQVEKIIEQYGLSNTKLYGYDFYKANSSAGLKEINNAQYLKLREDYNLDKFSGDIKNIALYVLIVYAFNNQIRFNNSGLYNMPTGKRDFNSKMEEKLMIFKESITNNNVSFHNYDFRKVLKNIKNKNDFVYLDPPYLISTASYNENSAWTRKDELDLLNSLDNLDQRGIKFALSNVTRHKGEENVVLIEWAKKYNVHILNHNYNNSNYQSRAKQYETIEVLITNY